MKAMKAMKGRIKVGGFFIFGKPKRNNCNFYPT